MAETVLAVPCCHLMFMTYIFRHCGLLILKIISVQAHRNVERERACMCLVCELHKLIILSKFVTEKEKKKSRKRKNATLTLQQNNCICCFIKFLCYFESECECVNDKSVKFQLMHYDYTSYLLTTHLDYPNYTCAFGG